MSTFGCSNAQRFQTKVNAVPGPGAYDVKSEKGSLQLKKVHRKLKPEFSLNRRPVAIIVKEDCLSISNDAKLAKAVEAPDMATRQIQNSQIALIVKDSNRQVQSQKSKTSSLTWKKTFIPPSIPVGKYLFGYREKSTLQPNFSRWRINT